MTSHILLPVLRPLIALLALPAAAQAACDPGETELRFGLSVPLEDTTEGATALALTEAANAALQGRYCMTPDAETFGDDAALLAAVNTGEIAFAAPSVTSLSATAPSLTLIDLPFLFDSGQHLIHYLESDAALPLLADVTKDGLIAHGIIATGTRQLVGPGALTAPQDAAGVTFTSVDPGPHSGALLAALGANTVDMPRADVAQALTSGTTSGAEASWSTIDYDYLYAAPAVVTETNHGATGFVLLASAAMMEALPPADRQILEDLVKAEIHQQSVLAYEREQISRRVVLDDGGTISPLSAEDRAAYRKVAAPLIDAARAALGADLIDAAIASNAEMPAQL